MAYDHAPAQWLARTAALMGDPTRATILLALLDGCASTSGELARLSGSSPQATSNHLKRLCAGGLLRAERVGRFRAYRLANDEIGYIVEALAAAGHPGQWEATLETPSWARVCYHHLAGQVGVKLAQAMSGRGWLQFSGAALGVTVEGEAQLRQLGLPDQPGAFQGRACLDLTEQKIHVGGPLGANLYRRFLQLGWVSPLPGSCEVTVSNEGVYGLKEVFSIKL